jgi:hypothetical protein
MIRLWIQKYFHTSNNITPSMALWVTSHPTPVNIPVSISALISSKGITKFGSFILNTAAPNYITAHYRGTVKIKQVFCYEMSVLLQCTCTSHCFLSVIIFPNTNHPSVHQWQHAILSIWLWDSFSTTLLFKSFWGTGDDRWWNCLPIHFVSG